MTTFDSLKWALRQKAPKTESSLKQPLSETQYSAGFDILTRGSGWLTYQDFIIPQLSELLAPLFKSRISISALEIGPGPKSLLGYLPDRLRQKVKRYAAFEPSHVFSSRLEEWLSSTSETECPLPCLESPPDIHRAPFVLNSNTGSGTDTGRRDNDEKFDIILFCHSMYSMKPEVKFIEQALSMLVEQPEGGMVVVFHCDGALQLNGLVCHRTASFPTGAICVADNDEVLDCFTPIVAGFVMQDAEVNKGIQIEWRKVCRLLGRRDEAHPERLFIGWPNVMAAFTKHATALPELTAQVPLLNGGKTVKNRESRLHNPAAIVKPREIEQVQQCVRWALKHGVSLTVIGGGHSAHCLWTHVISVDMSNFHQVHVLTAGSDQDSDSGFGSLVVAEAGCKTGDIVRKTMATGVTVPLGTRPSVGAGLWLQGGIGHLARMYGLSCDAIVGAVVVSIDSSQVLCIGCVPSQHRPAGAIRPENDTDLLWAIKGAGTNFGIVVRVTFKAYIAPTYATRNWVVPLSDKLEARLKLNNFDECVARKLPRNCSADAYLYWDNSQLHFGVTMVECSTTGLTSETPMPTTGRTVLGLEDNFKVVNGVDLFEAEIYMFGMHVGHGGSRTFSFKRCLFLKNIGEPSVADILVAAVETRPSPLCYLHLLQGGGAVGDVAPDATAFGCRDWDFACVVTGVWTHDQDETEVAQAAIEWVYKVARDLLPVSSGVYSADLGPDPRDTELATKAFGANRPRLARLKHRWDPRNTLAYTCPLPKAKAPLRQKLIILVTGESGVGKDYCADIWVSVFIKCAHKNLVARAVSISDVTKKEYARATGADLQRLLYDRAYKEQHRSALTTFFQSQVRHRSRLPEEHFLNVVYNAMDVDVLLITGMRDEAPVAAFSHLVSDSRLLEVRVKASTETRWARRECHVGDGDGDDKRNSISDRSNLKVLDYRPSLIFDNDATGDEAAERFAEHDLLPFFHEDLQRLSNMVRPVLDFPRPGIEFQHVLNISQQPGGLILCTSLLQTHFTGDWAKVDVVVCCEAGGFLYASALASRVDVPLALIRDAGKLPPPTISVAKPTSHISSSDSSNLGEKEIEMECNLIPRGASVVVVDDVLATGQTLCAVLQLLDEAGIGAEDISIIVVAEFPVHRGRELLRRHGFGRVNLQSLLVFDGA
ncbi:uncharacterized protein N7459_001306 [Penicillium hispanicum]|uniref:uncharacterized protein n=1 Tax=Penicillium hispanicum TaxID=1080232 RepID=UPI002540E2B0|nr:uncharacterized protein N7459_001306 [Penicillium hispanicum]KAJ5595098.1 hypothetical protein N7459_001306 [Penicillium hispanicum]